MYLMSNNCTYNGKYIAASADVQIWDRQLSQSVWTTAQLWEDVYTRHLARMNDGK